MTPPPYAEFVRLKMIELRKTKSLSQHDFGEILGLSATNISALERARHEWSLTHIATALARFGLPRSFFNLAALPEEEDTAALFRQSTTYLQQMSSLSPASKSALYKYSLLDNERRGIIDKMIEAAEHTDLPVFRAVLALLRESFK